MSCEAAKRLTVYRPASYSIRTSVPCQQSLKCHKPKNATNNGLHWGQAWAKGQRAVHGSKYTCPAGLELRKGIGCRWLMALKAGLVIGSPAESAREQNS